LTVTAVREGKSVEAEIAVANVGVGHDLPTGPTGRILLLEVVALGPNGNPLPLDAGPRLSPQVKGTTAGAGKIFARDARATNSPDRGTPLAPFATDVSHYRFAALQIGPVEVTARLLLGPVEGDLVEIAKTVTLCHGSDAKQKFHDTTEVSHEDPES
jgi:hypothetical protein